MSELQIVHRCDHCNGPCQPRIENITRTPSRCVLVEANKLTQIISTDDYDEKINVWAAAGPSEITDPSPYSIDLITLEKASAMRNGLIILREKLSVERIKSFSEEHAEEKEQIPIAADDDDDDDETFNDCSDDTDDDDDDDDVTTNDGEA